jgi:hypothetical protein
MPFPVDLSNVFPSKIGQEESRPLTLGSGTLIVTVRMEDDSLYSVRVASESGQVLEQTRRPVPRDAAEFWYRDFRLEHLGARR